MNTTQPQQEETQNEEEEYHRSDNSNDLKNYYVNGELTYHTDDEDENIPDEVMQKYHSQVEESENYDVYDFPGFRYMGLIVPIVYDTGDDVEEVEDDDPNRNEVIRAAEKAIENFNEKHGKLYRFDKVVRATGGVCAGIMYYITFLAKEDIGGEATTFQAQVWGKIGNELDVEVCRVKI